MRIIALNLDDPGNIKKIEALVKQLKKSDIIEYIQVEPLNVQYAPPGDIYPTTDDLVPYQTFRELDPYQYRIFLNVQQIISSRNQLGQGKRFYDWVQAVRKDGMYSFESPRISAQKTSVELIRETGEHLKTLNFSSYNYLGFGYHPEVIKAVQDAVAKYGLGAATFYSL